MRYLRLLLTLVAVGLLVLAATPWVDRIQPTWLPAVQSLGRLWIAAAVVGLVLSLVVRAWLALGANLVVIAVALVTILNVSNRPGCEGGEERLAVMALNAEYGRADVQQLADAVRRHDVDVLVISEVDEPMIADLMATEPGRRFLHRSAQTVEASGPAGTVVLSRYPATRVEVPQGTGTFQQPAMSIDVAGRAVLLRAVHPQPPVARSIEQWRDGLLELGQWQRANRGRPLVLAGDFNASAAHAPFRDAKRGMYDVAGLWPTATWPRERWYPPFADIDHVLVRGLSVKDSGTEDIDDTDHRAVWADLRVCPR